MSPFDEARKALGEGPSSSRRAQQLARLLQTVEARPRRSSRGRLLFAGALAVALAVLGAAIIQVRRGGVAPEPQAPPLAGMRLEGALLPALDFLDGSSVALDPNSAARLDVVDERQVELTLERGSLFAQIEKGTGRTWRYHAGPWLVTVRGTRLQIGYTPEHGELEVHVTQGAVEVTGPGGAQRVEAGQRLRRSVGSAAAPDAAPAPAPAPAPTVPQGPAVERVPPRRPPPPPEVEPVHGEFWLELLRGGSRAAALDEAGRQGVFTRLAELDEGEVLQLADAARQERRGPLARALLAHALKRGQAGAAEAAYLLGRLDADDGRRQEARSSFSQSLALAPQGPFAEQSRGRLLEVLVDLEDLPAASQAAAEYLQGYPTGAWAGLAKKVVGAPAP